MRLAAVREALHAQPFEPFSLRLVDGRDVAIPHPDFLTIYKRRIVVTNPKTGARSIIDPFLIISLEFAGQPP